MDLVPLACENDLELCTLRSVSGIISRLQYLKDLGIGAVWLSPFYKSPMKDFGYDVSDYRDVEPTFGTLQDFDLMIKTSHELGLFVCLFDLT